MIDLVIFNLMLIPMAVVVIWLWRHIDWDRFNTETRYADLRRKWQERRRAHR